MAKEKSKEPEFRYLRSVSLWDVEQIEKMKLVLLLDPKKAKKLTEPQKNNQVTALIWLLHVDTDQDEVERFIKAEKWKAEVKKFKRNPASLAALPEVVPAIMQAKRLLEQNDFVSIVEAATAEADGEEDEEGESES